MEQKIIVKGARSHNLKNIDVEIPRGSLTVITGPSGSGKSSLAFDTIYAEGQRRYVESISAYARQFLGQMEKPDVDSIEGLSPAIAIDQKTTSKNPRSTVGTATEIYDYLRLLYASIGRPHCPVCKKEIKHQTIDQIIDKILELPLGTKIQVLSPVVMGEKGTHVKTLEKIRKEGYIRARIDGTIYDLSTDEEIDLGKNKKHTIEVVVDRLVIKEDIRSRLADAVETACNLSKGLVTVNDASNNKDVTFSKNYACPKHGVSVGEISHRIFSFNNPYGACKVCTGLGFSMHIDISLILPNKNLSIRNGAIKGSGWALEGNSIANMYMESLAQKYNFSLDEPVKNLPEDILNIILYGSDEPIEVYRYINGNKITYETKFEGIVNNLERRYKDTSSAWVKEEIASYMVSCPCPECNGQRLCKESLSVTVNKLNISELCEKSVLDILKFILEIKLSEKEKIIAKEIIKEIKNRLNFLKDVGLDYLTLSRTTGTLSGGENQRIRLATQIGSLLTGVLYVLDEPSIGLHQRDNNKLIATLKNLRDLGNTVIVVEHDEDTMYAADHIVDIGPGAGVHGGKLVCSGTVDDIKKCKNSLTGQYLNGEKYIPVPQRRKRKPGKDLKIIRATEHNLKNVTVDIPLEQFVCVTGVSGSGKSSLIIDVLYKTLAKKLNRAKTVPGKVEDIKGLEFLDKVVNVSQSPIGRTPRSNPVTYMGVFTDIRELFSETNEAKLAGYKSGRFSFNVKGGRCEACEGDGETKIEMHFLPDVYVPCDICGGSRYNKETLKIKYRGKNIYDVLEMTAEEATNFFSNIPRIYSKLKILCDVGLSYIKLGQSATTLSGGEAQRVKLATELSKRATGKTIYILDEPTTGLHISDVHKLVNILQKLVSLGNTVVTIEHNLDFIKTADYIIDIGPEGGDGGGQVIAYGTPEEIVLNEKSYTGSFLKKYI